MRSQKIIFLVLGIIVSSFSFSQRSSDIGVGVTSFDQSRIFAEFRLPVKEKYTFNIASTFGAYSSPFGAQGVVVAATDSTVSIRHSFSSYNAVDLQLGMSRQLKESMFYIDGRLIVGYFQAKHHKSNTNWALGSNGEWEFPTYLLDPLVMDSTRAHVTRHFINYGIQIGAGMNIPLGQRFLINLSIEGQAFTRSFIDDSNKFDPYGEYNWTPGTFTFNFNMLAAAGIRYVFGKKEKAIE